MKTVSTSKAEIRLRITALGTVRVGNQFYAPAAVPPRKITMVLLYVKFSEVEYCFRCGSEQNITNVTMGDANPCRYDDTDTPDDAIEYHTALR
jgi:hypothetical protein